MANEFSIRLVMPERPVLLELEGADGPALAAIHNSDAMTVRIDVLSQSGYQAIWYRMRVPRRGVLMQ